MRAYCQQMSIEDTKVILTVLSTKPAIYSLSSIEDFRILITQFALIVGFGVYPGTRQGLIVVQAWKKKTGNLVIMELDLTTGQISKTDVFKNIHNIVSMCDTSIQHTVARRSKVWLFQSLSACVRTCVCACVCVCVCVCVDVCVQAKYKHQY